MPSIDLVFPVIGSRLPTDHAYPLYSAVSHLLPRLHSGEVPFGIATITGDYAGNGQLLLDPRRSRLRLRVPLDSIPDVLPLAGKVLQVMGQGLQLGAPHIQALIPSPSLIAHAVTIKHATDERPFLTAARRQLDALGIGGRLELPRIQFGPRQGEPRRHIVRIKESSIVCFGMIVHDLTGEESIRLQENGLGGRRRMNGGIFLPAAEGQP